MARNREYYAHSIPREWLTERLDHYAGVVDEDSELVENLFQDIVDTAKDPRKQIELIENLVSEHRAFQKYLLAMHPDDHVLNLGCGWDNTSINLARTVGQVTAIDLTHERLQLLALKKRYYGLHNLQLCCGGDTPLLPFASETFDAVLINGVLEWVAADWSFQQAKYAKSGAFGKAMNYISEVYTSHRPNEIQKNFLAEVRRVLKPNGQAYIGTDNRFAREYFTGQPDRHSDLRFGSLYPRPLAHLISTLKKGKPYLTYTYGRKGYQRLLEEVGFGSARFWGVEPNYRSPEKIIDFGRQNHVKQYIKGHESRKVRALPTRLYKATVPCFGIVGSSGQPSLSWLEAVVEDFAKNTGHKASGYQIESTMVNRKGKLLTLLRSPNKEVPRAIIKVPFTPGASENCRRNNKGLTAFGRACESTGTRNRLCRFPEFVYEGHLGKQWYCVETCLPGSPWNPTQSPKLGDSLCKEVIDSLVALSHLDIGEYSIEEEVAEYRHRLTTLTGLTQNPDRYDRLIDRLTGTIEDTLNEHPHKVTLRKGDFTVSNVMVQNDALAGIIDLDEWGRTRLLLANFTDFTFSLSRYLKQLSFSKTMLLLLNGSYSRLPSELRIHATISKLGASKRDMDAAAVASWINHAYYGMQVPASRLNRTTVKHVVVEVLDLLQSRFR